MKASTIARGRSGRNGEDQDVSQPEPAGLAPRRVAAKLLGAVIDARTPLDGLTDAQNGHPHYRALTSRDRALARAILSSALRFRRTIEALVAARLDRKLPANATALSHILHVGAAQVLFLDVPDSAAVDLAVAHAKADPRTRRFSGLVNAVLREIGRRKARALPAALAQTIEAPDWFADRLELAYGAETMRAILEAHRQEAPIDLTVKADASSWAKRLGGMVLPTGSVRLGAVDGAVTGLDGFDEGAWWVQDGAAAIPVQLMGNLDGMSVGDLCAAPGGKTAQLATAGARVTAVEKSPGRARRLKENLDRLKVEAQIALGDLFEHRPETPYDAVLLDAPCSSTGTMRRHPDVAWTKGPEDVAKLARLQRRMLDHAITLVRPGGMVLFCNCSLDPLEGEEMVRAVLEDHPDLTADPVRPGEFAFADPFLTSDGFVRTTPAGWAQWGGMDGFFAARLHRN